MKPHTILMLLACLLASGCSTRTTSLYNLEEHSKAQFAVLAQADQTGRADYEGWLLHSIRQAEQHNRRVAPGVHAELGYLKAREGDGEAARRHFLMEKKLYPEAAVFIRRMLQGLGSPAASSQEGMISPPAAGGSAPKVVVVLPPVNRSNSRQAADILMPTLADDLIQAGYYVVPVTIVQWVLQTEGLSDTRLYMDGPLRGFRDAFGADAVLVSEILDWRKDFAGEASEMVIEIGAELRSTGNNQSFWSGQGRVRADLMSTNLAGASLEDIVVRRDIIEWRSAVADYWSYVGIASERLFQSLPHGPYGANSGSDG